MARRGSRVLRRAFLIGAGSLVLGIGARDSGFGVRLIAAGALLMAVPCGVWWRRWSGSAGTVRRWSWRSRWNHGLASRWQILWKASRFAMRRQMRTLRPSYRELSFWARLRVPTSEFAYRLCKVGWLWVWASCEDVKQTLGGPRYGKSVEEICRIIDAPGAVIATSTRTDLYEKTHRLRELRGPVFVFNPSGMGGIATDVTFDPLTGCTDPKTAVDRAGDLIAGAGSTGSDGSSQGDREHWAGQARDTLAVLMHAAALGGASMRDVHAWVSNPKPHYNKVREMLDASPEAVGFGHELEHFVNTNDRTLTSITQSIRPALMWLHDPGAARAAGQPVTGPVIDATGVTVPLPDGPPAPGLDVEALLFQRGTVYLLGAEDAQLAPLLTALTGHIARTGRQVAGRLPDGRLDPPATFALDEAPNICLVPLPQVDQRFRRAGHADAHPGPVQRAAGATLGPARRCGDHEQRRGGGHLRRHQGRGRPARALHADRRPRRTRDHPRSPRQGDLGVHAPGADLQPGPARAAAEVPRGGDPPRPTAGDRQGRAVLETRRLPRRAAGRPTREARRDLGAAPRGRRALLGRTEGRRGRAGRRRQPTWPASCTSSTGKRSHAARNAAPSRPRLSGPRTSRSTRNRPARTGTTRHPTVKTGPARAVTAMTDTTATTATVAATAARPGWLIHPVQAWRAYQAALAERADAEARAAGLTVEDVGRGVRRYRDPVLDQLAAHRAGSVPYAGGTGRGQGSRGLVVAEAGRGGRCAGRPGRRAGVRHEPRCRGSRRRAARRWAGCAGEPRDGPPWRAGCSWLSDRPAGRAQHGRGRGGTRPATPA